MRAALTRRSRASVSERPASDDHATSPERWLAGNCGKQAIGEEIADACGLTSMKAVVEEAIRREAP